MSDAGSRAEASAPGHRGTPGESSGGPWRLRTVLANIGLTTLALAVSLAGVELALRGFFPQRLGVWYPERDGLTILWPRLSTYLPHSGVSVNVNSFGMRDRDYSLGKKEGVFRILILGDSFMEALQTPFEKTFPRLLEEELKRNGPGAIEVVSAAVSGWGTTDELVYLKKSGLRFEPDLVLVGMTLHNDVSDNLKEQFHARVDGQLVERPPVRMPLLQYRMLEMRAFLASRSHLYALLLKARRLGRNREEGQRLQRHVADLFLQPPPTHLKEGWQMTFELLSRIVRAGAEAGARTAVFLVPLSCQLTDEEFSAVVGTAPPATVVLREQPQQLMRAWGAKEGIEVIDPLSQMREWRQMHGRRLYLVGDGHWNEDGHRLAAAIVGRELVGRDLVGRTDRARPD